MNRFKNTLSFIGDMFDSYAERDAKIKSLTKDILAKSYGVDYDQAEKIAAVLIDKAEPIVWK